MQWITTSSPGFHLVTPSPTFQTMPEASEPPMWWPHCGMVAVAEHRDGLAERRPDVVEVDARGHHAHDHLEGAGLRHLDLLELEGVLRLALALGADHPGGHLLRQLARLDVELRDLGYVYGHGPPVRVGAGIGRRAASYRQLPVRRPDYFRESPWKRRRSHSYPSTRPTRRRRRPRARRPAGDRAADGRGRARRAGRARARGARPGGRSRRSPRRSRSAPGCSTARTTAAEVDYVRREFEAGMRRAR